LTRIGRCFRRCSRFKETELKETCHLLSGIEGGHYGRKGKEGLKDGLKEGLKKDKKEDFGGGLVEGGLEEGQGGLEGDLVEEGLVEGGLAL